MDFRFVIRSRFTLTLNLQIQCCKTHKTKTYLLFAGSLNSANFLHLTRKTNPNSEAYNCQKKKKNPVAAKMFSCQEVTLDATGEDRTYLLLNVSLSAECITWSPELSCPKCRIHSSAMRSIDIQLNTHWSILHFMNNRNENNGNRDAGGPRATKRLKEGRSLVVLGQTLIGHSSVVCSLRLSSVK